MTGIVSKLRSKIGYGQRMVGWKEPKAYTRSVMSPARVYRDYPRVQALGFVLLAAMFLAMALLGDGDLPIGLSLAFSVGLAAVFQVAGTIGVGFGTRRVSFRERGVVFRSTLFNAKWKYPDVAFDFTTDEVRGRTFHVLRIEPVRGRSHAIALPDAITPEDLAARMGQVVKVTGRPITPGAH